MRRFNSKAQNPPYKPSPNYHFVVYALDTVVEQKPHTPPLTRAELLDASKGHITGRGDLVVTYERH